MFHIYLQYLRPSMAGYFHLPFSNGSFLCIFREILQFVLLLLILLSEVSYQVFCCSVEIVWLARKLGSTSFDWHSKRLHCHSNNFRLVISKLLRSLFPMLLVPWRNLCFFMCTSVEQICYKEFFHFRVDFHLSFIFKNVHHYTYGF